MKWRHEPTFSANRCTSTWCIIDKGSNDPVPDIVLYLGIEDGMAFRYRVQMLLRIHARIVRGTEYGVHGWAVLPRYGYYLFQVLPHAL